jgi:hypothetical protein
VIEVVNHSPEPDGCFKRYLLRVRATVAADPGRAQRLLRGFSLVSGVFAGKTAFSSPQTPTVANFVPCSQSLRAEIPAHAVTEKLSACRERESAFGVMAGIGLLRPMALEKAWPDRRPLVAGGQNFSRRLIPRARHRL